jgi:hypothetical protein
MKPISEVTIGSTIKDLEDRTKNVADESERWVKAITGEGGVVDSLDAEYDAILKELEGYELIRDSLKLTVVEYEKLADAIDLVK